MLIYFQQLPIPSDPRHKTHHKIVFFSFLLFSEAKEWNKRNNIGMFISEHHQYIFWQ